ncbi:MAG TPA: anti-sigma factor [Euzebyales bacterium]|nr:anti-sigma factor [Euzebyales bacterium]
MSVHDLLPLYALDSLPDDERAVFEQHLRTCDRCADELASYEPALTHMAADVEEAPSPRLKADVMARIRSVPQEAPVPAEPRDAPVTARPQEAPATAERTTEPLRLHPERRQPSRRFALAAAVLALAFLGVSATGLGLWRRTQVLEEQLAQARAETELASIMMADDAEVIDLDSQVSGTLRVAMAPSLDAGMVLADDLEAPPEDSAYQLWVLDDGQPRSAGVVSRRNGVIGQLTDVAAADGVAVSIEPRSGSTAPTGPIVAQAEFG